jgi:hypothetical protein
MGAVQQLGRRSALRRNALRASGALMIIGLALGTYALVRARSEQAQQSHPVTAKVQPPAAERREPRVTAVVPKTPAKPDTTVTVKPPRDRDRDKPRTPRPPPIDPTLPRRVVFDPFPANVSIGINGGDPRAFGPSFRDTELVPGVHRFKFLGAHDCCIDEEISMKIEPGEGAVTIEKRLKFRPAVLYVVTETPANVVVDEGRVAGRSHSLIEVGDMDALTESHSIKVSADGHNEHTQVVRLRAGQVVTVPVQLTKTGT